MHPHPLESARHRLTYPLNQTHNTVMNERSGIRPIPVAESVPTRRMASLEADFQHLEAVLGEPAWRGDDTFPGDDEHQRVFWRTRDAHSGAVLCVWDWDAPTATIAANTKWNVYWADGPHADGSGRELYEQLQMALLAIEVGEPEEAYIAGVIPPKATVDWARREAEAQEARDERYGWSRQAGRRRRRRRRRRGPAWRPNAPGWKRTTRDVRRRPRRDRRSARRAPRRTGRKSRRSERAIRRRS